MKVSLSDLRAAIADTVTATGEIVCTSTYPAAPIPPFAVAGFPDLIDYDKTMGGYSTVYLPVTVWVSMADADTGQTELDALLSGGIRAALQTATAVEWHTCQVDSVNNIRPDDVGSATLAADINLTLTA